MGPLRAVIISSVGLTELAPIRDVYSFADFGKVTVSQALAGAHRFKHSSKCILERQTCACYEPVPYHRLYRPADSEPRLSIQT